MRRGAVSGSARTGPSSLSCTPLPSSSVFSVSLWPLCSLSTRGTGGARTTGSEMLFRTGVPTVAGDGADVGLEVDRAVVLEAAADGPAAAIVVEGDGEAGGVGGVGLAGEEAEAVSRVGDHLARFAVR